MLTAGGRTVTLLAADAGRPHSLALVRIDDGRFACGAALRDVSAVMDHRPLDALRAIP
jgi:hypothetical protein